jgi:ElaA protein
VDDLDQVSWHLMGWRKDSADKKLVAYLRVVFPGEKYQEPSIGRVITAPSVRRTGLGYALTQEAISRIVHIYPKTAIRISAQQYLEKFYSKFEFEKVGDPYDEDGIPHIEMLRKKA